MRVIDETSEHEEETIKRVENFQELANGSAALDQNDMDFGGSNNTGGKKASVSLNSLISIETIGTVYSQGR